MLLPVAPANLVGNQLVGGVIIGNAKQRLGKAHQNHALLARQRVFLHELVNATLLLAALAHLLDQARRQFLRLARIVSIEPRLGGKLA